MQLKTNPRAKALHARPVKLLSGDQIKIYPNKWRQTSGVKEFDESTTSFLRVMKHLDQDTYLVHGMRAVNDKVVEEVYDFAAVVEEIPSVVKSVAARCGVSALIPKLA